ncbi:MAG: hypothetical protein ABI670_12790 [Chloroflexota bacterium]
MNLRRTGALLPAILLVFLTACDNGTPATPSTAPTATTAAAVSSPTPAPVGEVATPAASAPAAPTGTVVDAAPVASPTIPSTEVPAPTAVKATATGEAVTSLQALTELKARAISWQSDARLVMLANVRPGQAARLLGVALGDPDVTEPTPGGKGRNWALIAFSPSTKGAVALTMDGSQTDLVKEGALTDDMVQSFGSDEMAALQLSSLDVSKLVDSDELASKASDAVQAAGIGIAMLAPDGLGLGPLPTPAAGGQPAQLAYELFSTDPTQQAFLFFDGMTGEVLIDSAKP